MPSAPRGRPVCSAAFRPSPRSAAVTAAESQRDAGATERVEARTTNSPVLVDALGDADFGYACWRWFYQLAFTLFFRIRVWHAERVPERGGVILAANHQSFLDPPVAGLALGRQLCFLARSSLFKGPLLRAWFRAQHGVPIERGGGDLAAIRRVVGLLREGHGLVMFPEGTRTRDGSVGPFEPGVALIAARARVPVVPVAIEGAFRAWPRWQKAPCWGRVQVAYGEPVPPPEGGKNACIAAAVEVRRRVVELLEGLRQRE